MHRRPAAPVFRPDPYAALRAICATPVTESDLALEDLSARWRQAAWRWATHLLHALVFALAGALALGWAVLLVGWP